MWLIGGVAAAEPGVDVGGEWRDWRSLKTFQPENVLQRFDGRKYVVGYEMYVGSIGRAAGQCIIMISRRELISGWFAPFITFACGGDRAVRFVRYYFICSRSTPPRAPNFALARSGFRLVMRRSANQLMAHRG